MNYKVCLIGTKDTTLTTAKFMLEKVGKIDCIITVDQSKVNVGNISGFMTLDDFAKKNQIPLFKVQDYSMRDEQSREFFESNTFDIAVCMGWQRLIPEYVLSRFSIGIFGFHGSCGYLPYARGRSPLNWSVINGDERFILNLFKYDTGVDSPNVYKNIMFEISAHDDIRTLQYKVMLSSFKMIESLLSDYKKGTVSIKSTSKDFDSLYVKRTPADGKIDFTKKTREIYNLIRGVTKPFPGAFCFKKDSEDKIFIWNAKPFDGIMDFSDYEVGEIIDIFEDRLIIRTIDGSLIVNQYETNVSLNKNDKLN